MMAIIDRPTEKRMLAINDRPIEKRMLATIDRRIEKRMLAINDRRIEKRMLATNDRPFAVHPRSSIHAMQNHVVNFTAVGHILIIARFVRDRFLIYRSWRYAS